MTARKNGTKALSPPQMARNTIQYWWFIVRHSLVPLTLVVFVPIITMLLMLYPLQNGISAFEFQMLLGNRCSWTWACAVIFWAILSLKVPSASYYGPPDEFDIRPKYSANGLTFYFTSVALFLALNAWKPSISTSAYDNMPQMIGTFSIIAFILCWYLWWKGKYSRGCETRRKSEKFPAIFEFYRGMEFHPRIFGFQVKQLTNCRIGLMMWQILILAFMFTSFQRTGFNSGILVNVLLQSIYLMKFFSWETGYFTTLDITMDRAGFYICWGCLVLVPSLYTFSTYYFVSHPPTTGHITSALIFIFGVLSIYLNYQIDRQKEIFKESNGKCKIWGKPPAYISTEYKTGNTVKKALLLTSGYWGIARHLNYDFELALALLWNLPGWNMGIAPFLYNGFLTFLLVHRIYRDEEKCVAKYGKAWKEYCNKVPHRLIPGIY